MPHTPPKRGKMLCFHARKLPLAPNGSQWLPVVPSSSQWPPMARSGSQWLPMAANGPKWLPMAPSGCQWLPVARSGSQWLPVALPNLCEGRHAHPSRSPPSLVDGLCTWAVWVDLESEPCCVPWLREAIGAAMECVAHIRATVAAPPARYPQRRSSAEGATSRATDLLRNPKP